MRLLIVNPRIAIQPFTIWLYRLNPKSNFNPPDASSLSCIGGRCKLDPDKDQTRFSTSWSSRVQLSCQLRCDNRVGPG
ncbi:unnamed protein product [Prunus armeniaca]|uniref:Uncharacterized protein n=1 Tax=Prunus armeniaca TaxID=36596 RepID=A0A6J5VC70_PRUAR|nr:unnamed protein product [Prunus armeniaca]